MIIKIIDENLVIDLETSHHEYNSYLNMLENSKINGYDEEYWSLWKQFMEVRAEYDTLKEHIRVDYVIPAVGENYPGWWEIDFNKNEIIIHHN